MPTTKQRIIDAALELFNRDGLSKTTLRGIAQHLGMSQGNLNYHFKLKDELIEALYFELVNKMNELTKELSRHLNLLELVYESSTKMMNQMIEYRFVFRDFYTIMNENTTIRNHYRLLVQQRVIEFNHVFTGLIKSEFIREEEFEGEYHRLFQRMSISGDNWINVLELFSTDAELDESKRFYAHLLFEHIYPYLTEKGKIAYLSINFD